MVGLLFGHKVAALPMKSFWSWAWAPQAGLVKMLGSSESLRSKRAPREPWAQGRVLGPEKRSLELVPGSKIAKNIRPDSNNSQTGF